MVVYFRTAAVFIIFCSSFPLVIVVSFPYSGISFSNTPFIMLFCNCLLFNKLITGILLFVMVGYAVGIATFIRLIFY